LRALESARKPRLHLFLATSEIHRRYKLGKAKSEIVRLAVNAVKQARQTLDNIEFSPEDASRTEPEFLLEVAQAVAAAGARTLNIPDTVGYAVPEEFGALIAFLRQRLGREIAISVHCHNDLGLSVANSLAAIAAGADQVEATVNGIGERAGNASLEEIAVTLHIRRDYWKCRTNIKLSELYRASRLVSIQTGLVVQRNKAVVGANAFKHEAGIHQDGILKDRRTYEIIEPSLIGVPESELVLGKHSGRHALNARLVKLGYRFREDELVRIFERFKDLADKKKEVTDADLMALMEETIAPLSETYTLEYLSTVAGTNTIPMATVRLKKGGETSQAISNGDGPVDAACKAIDQITGLKARLSNYRINAVTGGRDALGEVTLLINVEGREIPGRGVSTDIVEASVKAYLNAVNRYFQHQAGSAGEETETPSL
ncbi:MAG TPA: 2-isopropylmalate synthase, partial [bacterium]|nr:2-isopropylmalate synthase [bacterium]